MTRNAVPIGHIGDYEIKQLKIFKVVADCGGFSAAETELNVSRSTISIHISNLESRLNLADNSTRTPIDHQSISPTWKSSVEAHLWN